jgi:hypothetical protein
LEEVQITAMAGGDLDYPLLHALRILWRAAPQLFRKDLAEMGIVRAVPQSASDPSPASLAFWSACRALGVRNTALLVVPSGPAVRVVATTPPSVLIGPSARDASPELRFRLARAAAMTMPDYLLACALPPNELAATLCAVEAAFGKSPARGSLDFAAASLAQNLWTAMPVETQEELRLVLDKAPAIDAEGVRTIAMGAVGRLGLAATGDVRAAVRVTVGDDPFLAGTDPSTEEGFKRAAHRSEHVAALIHLAIDPSFGQLGWRLAPVEP